MMPILRDRKCDGYTVESTCHDNRHFAFQRQQALQHTWFPVQGHKRGIKLGYAVYPYLTFAVISQTAHFQKARKQILQPFRISGAPTHAQPTETGEAAEPFKSSMTAYGATAKPFVTRNFFSRIRFCAIATLLAPGLTTQC